MVLSSLYIQGWDVVKKCICEVYTKMLTDKGTNKVITMRIISGHMHIYCPGKKCFAQIGREPSSNSSKGRISLSKPNICASHASVHCLHRTWYEESFEKRYSGILHSHSRLPTWLYHREISKWIINTEYQSIYSHLLFSYTNDINIPFIENHRISI